MIINFKKYRKIEPKSVLVNLVDMVFLLIFFFLLAGKISIDKGNLALPKSITDLKTEMKENLIYINKDGEVFYENRKVSPEELNIIMASLAAKDNFSIMADAELNAKLLLTVIENFKKSGAKEINIITNRAL